VTYGAGDSEQGSLQFRRSLDIVKDVRAGEPFTKENVRAIRPGFGLPPKFIDEVLGKTARVDLKRGTALKTDHFI
jgi:N-acetylneuraminate synthase